MESPSSDTKSLITRLHPRNEQKYRRGCRIPGVPSRLGVSHNMEGHMTPKLNPFVVAPELMKKWQGTSIAIAASLEPALVHLVEIRASQINGCANCLNMH